MGRVNLINKNNIGSKLQDEDKKEKIVGRLHLSSVLVVAVEEVLTAVSLHL